MRPRLAFLIAATVPLILMLDIAIWVLARERRLMRTAVVAGLIVGKVAAATAW